MEIKQMAERLNNVPVRKKAKRILALMLAVMMVNAFTSYGLVAHAEERESKTEPAAKKVTEERDTLAEGVSLTKGVFPQGAVLHAEEVTKPVGEGTVGSPYQITSAAELYWFAKLVNGVSPDGTAQNTKACAKLMNDISADDYSGGIWSPIGGNTKNEYNYGTAYEGTFDGGNHTVSNLYCSYSDTINFIGFFGACKNATIKNLKLAASEITGGLYVGGICGYNDNSTISNCVNGADISAVITVGGICGYNGGSVEKCANTGAVSASHEFESECGGIIGKNLNYKSISNCWNSGKVTSKNGSGGICGRNQDTASITNCYNYGEVTKNTFCGAVVGVNSTNAILSNCYYDTNFSVSNGIESENSSTSSVTGKATAEFFSGEVCYLLNNSVSDGTQVWYQNIDNGNTRDAYPQLSGGTVYQSGNGYSNFIVTVAINAQPQNVASATYGYTSAPTMSVAAEKTDAAPSGSEISYQWYRVKSGGETSDTPVGTNSSTLTIPTGLDARTHSFYCAVSCDDYRVNSKTADITVTQSGTTFDGGITADKTDKTYTYGDTITVTAKPKATGTPPVTKDLRTMRSFSAPTANQMALFVGETQISDPVDGDSNGVYTMTYDTTDKALAIGSNTITAKYVESANMAEYSGAVTVTLNKKPLTAIRSGGSRTYDGTNSPLPGFNKTNGLTGVLGSDDVNALVSGTLPDANVGKDKVFTATGVTLSGADAGYYSLAVNDVHMTMDVTPMLIAPIPQNSTRNMVVGVGTFSEPTFLCSIVNENITGTFEYDYNGKTNYADVVSELAKLSKGATAEVKFKFTTNGNYEGMIPGTLSITVIGLEFAGKDKALTLKAGPIYGDTWSQIVSFDTSKLSATLDGKAVAGTYTLMIDGTPFNGTDISKSGTHSYKLTFSTTDNSFTDVEAMSGNVDVAQREGVLSWGDTAFTYNGSAQKPMVRITNKVTGDDVVASVANSQAQTNVGTNYTATAVLSGNSASNYKLPLANTTTFSITAATATGSVAVSSTDTNSNKKLDSGDMVTADLSAVTPGGGTASYQWKKTVNGTTENIGTNQDTYTLISSDIKGKILCEVTFTDNTTGMISSNKLDIAKEILTGAITITGENKAGSALTVSLPTNVGISNNDYAIQWCRDNVAITGANAPSYTITKEDLGKSLKVVITAKEASEGFTGTMTSNVFNIPAIAPDKAVVSASAGNGYITVNWTKPSANGSDITGYSLSVKQGETQIAGSPFAIGADAISYKVENLIDGTDYTFMLSTINGEGSTASNTVTAKPQKPSDGGGSSGGSSSGSSTTTTTTPEKKPNQPGTAAVTVAATVGANGAASVSIPDKAVNDAIAKAQADVASQGKTANGISVELDVTMPKGATSLMAVLTRSSLESLVSTGVSSLEINGFLVSVSFDKKALAEIQKQSTGNISIAIVPKTNLSDVAKKMIGTRPVYDITVGYDSVKSVSSFGGGIATVSIPYTLGKNEAADGLYAVYVDEKGNATRIAGSAYDANSGCVIFTTNHFSQYGIGYTAPSAKFTDISTHWAKESIDYVVGRGLFSGTSKTSFSPDAPMTRQMIWMVLARMDGKTPANMDEARNWAMENSFSDGSNPTNSISREQLTAILYRYATYKKYDITQGGMTIREFEDYDSISGYAKTPLSWAVNAGLIKGGNNKLMPHGDATRAQVAVILMRFHQKTAK